MSNPIDLEKVRASRRVRSLLLVLCTVARKRGSLAALSEHVNQTTDAIVSALTRDEGGGKV